MLVKIKIHTQEEKMEETISLKELFQTLKKRLGLIVVIMSFSCDCQWSC